jgi:hypothetical protein
LALNEGCLGGDRKEYTVNSLDIFDLPAEGVTCALGGPHKIRVWFRNPSPEEIKDGNPKSAAFCGAQGTWAPNAKVASMLADGAAGRLPPDHQIPKDELDLFLKDQRTLRETRCLPLSYLPAPAQSCLNQVHQELDESIRRAVKLMRWRFALPGSHNPFSARVQAERFTLDGAEWHSVRSNLQLSIVGLSSFRLTETP